MATRKPPSQKSLLERTPVAEWTAAAIGLVLTLGVIGYSLWEGLAARPGAPELSVMSEPAERTGGGYVVPLTIRNEAPATAAAVEVRGVLSQGGAVVEERRATFAYVPGRGQAKGGLLFERDPSDYELRIVAEGYEAP